ncbi:hypothetical protein LZC95_50150 [Pendulispora brunnea]|uniref:Bacteriophage protein n=1 Tax=Pendulispora brunnea TaxID=2905690 RepID=A0ABZ2KB35_9BACT
MSATTQERNTPQYGVDTIPQLVSRPAAAGVLLNQGAIAVLRAGFVVPGQTGTGLVVLGRVERTVDNRDGVAGALEVSIRMGVFKYGNSAGPDAIGRVNAGANCYLVDDQTLALTDDAGKRSRAGTIMDVDPLDGGVWALLGLGL